MSSTTSSPSPAYAVAPTASDPYLVASLLSSLKLLTSGSLARDRAAVLEALLVSVEGKVRKTPSAVAAAALRGNYGPSETLDEVLVRLRERHAALPSWAESVLGERYRATRTPAELAAARRRAEREAAVPQGAREWAQRRRVTT